MSNTYGITILSISLVLILFIILPAVAEKKTTSLSQFLPRADELKDWHPLGKPDQAIGEDLYVLINGGAEIYHEYGFKQALILTYKNSNRKSINVEIYEMTSPESAYGAFTFKTGKKGQHLPLGNEAILEDYYLNFWKGRFVITLIGFDTHSETIDGLIEIGWAIEKKILHSGRPPALPGLLPQTIYPLQKITYLRGNLVLFNHYHFDSGDIFGLKEGVIGHYSNLNVFIFKYQNSKESKRWFINAKNKLLTNGFFKDMGSNESTIVLRDKKNKIVYGKPLNNQIQIILCERIQDAHEFIEVMKNSKISGVETP